MFTLAGQRVLRKIFVKTTSAATKQLLLIMKKIRKRPVFNMRLAQGIINHAADKMSVSTVSTVS